MIRRLRGFVLELDPVDLMLMASVIEYGVQVRNLLAQRQNHRRQLAAAIAEELPIEAGVDEPSTVPGECAGTTDAGGDHATAGVPDYRQEDDALAANLVSDGVTGKRYR